MAELADAADSKFADLRVLGVRLPLPAPTLSPFGFRRLVSTACAVGRRNTLRRALLFSQRMGYMCSPRTRRTFPCKPETRRNHTPLRASYGDTTRRTCNTRATSNGLLRTPAHRRGTEWNSANEASRVLDAGPRQVRKPGVPLHHARSCPRARMATGRTVGAVATCRVPEGPACGTARRGSRNDFVLGNV